jgi:hypothetical protein
MTLRLHTAEVVPPSTSPQEHHVVVEHRIVPRRRAADASRPRLPGLRPVRARRGRGVPAGSAQHHHPGRAGAVYIIAKVGGWMVRTFPLATLLLLGAAVFLTLIRVGVIR